MDEPSADIVSIAELRADALRVTTGFMLVSLLPAMVGLMIIRDYWHGPEWSSFLAVGALFIVGIVVGQQARNYTSRMLKSVLWVAGVFGGLVFLTCVAMAGFAVYAFAFERDTRMGLFFGATALIMPLVMSWVVFSPWLSARRLLRVRLPPRSVPFTAVMEPLVRHEMFGRWTVGQSSTERTGLVYRLAAAALGVVGLGGVVRTLLHQDWSITTAFAFAAWFAAIMLLKRGAQLGAIGVAEALRRDTRPPVLYLRSFMDDAGNLTSDEWDRMGPLRRVEPFFRRLSPTTGWGGRLEEVLAVAVRRRGPFIAIANPHEKMPQLGAARAHHSDETWQNAIVEWLEMSQLIVQVAGPTPWIKWELETILANGAGSKLMVLFPPGDFGNQAARWENLNAVLKNTAWGPAFATLDRTRVIGVRLLDGGRLLAVVDGKFQNVDYRLAVGILLGATQSQQAA